MMQAGATKDEIEVLAADYTAFSRVLDRIIAAEFESFQGLSGQFGLREDMDALLERLAACRADIERRLATLRDGSAHTATEAGPLLVQTRLIDVMLQQLDRFATVADLRGAQATTGDLIPKIQGWIRMLRDWLASIMRQLDAMKG